MRPCNVRTLAVAALTQHAGEVCAYAALMQLGNDAAHPFGTSFEVESTVMASELTRLGVDSQEFSHSRCPMRANAMTTPTTAASRTATQICTPTHKRNQKL